MNDQKEIRKNTEDEILCCELINNFRAQDKLPPLVLDPFVSQICDNHTIHSLNTNALSHANLRERIDQIPDKLRCCENIGATFGTSGDAIQAIVDKWIESEEQRKNILDSCNKTGISVAKKGNCVFITQIFALCKTTEEMGEEKEFSNEDENEKLGKKLLALVNNFRHEKRQVGLIVDKLACEVEQVHAEICF
jgi:uncharacterized protein YkwD